MTTATTNELARALDLLKRIASLAPDEAMKILESAQLPETADLVWHRETFDQSLHYAVLIRDGEGGVISLSRSAGGLPWPLRGVQRWSEADVVRVNGRRMQVEEAIAFIDVDDHRSRVARSLIDSLLIQQELDREPVAIDPEGLQAELDAFRRARGLATADATQQWLVNEGLTQGGLERLLRDRLALRGLRSRIVTSAAVLDEFDRTRADFDEVLMTSIWLPALGASRRVIRELRQGLIRLDGRDAWPSRSAPSSPDIGVFVRRRRHEVPPSLGLVFECDAGATFGPLPLSDGYVVGRVHEVRPARLTADVRLAIELRLFEGWLDARRTSARIEWMWGRSAG
jgi:putative peptide maturation system protein